jgi:(E)-4-hydroxy-3-methylbut-2-enyl-diphosphate synthase
MGCVVNGPGEARSADLGIAAGKGRGHLFIKGQVVKVVKEKDMVEALVKEGRLLSEEGIEARLAAADKNAATIAEQDAKELLDSQGDINDFEKNKICRRDYLQIKILKIKTFNI